VSLTEIIEIGELENANHFRVPVQEKINTEQTGLINQLTVSLYHCITASLHHCITASLHHCITLCHLQIRPRDTFHHTRCGRHDLQKHKHGLHLADELFVFPRVVGGVVQAKVQTQGDQKQRKAQPSDHRDHQAPQGSPALAKHALFVAALPTQHVIRQASG